MSSKGRRFIKEFKKKFYGEYKNKLVNVYEGQRRKYTDLINEIVFKLIEDAGCQSNPEYFRIDYTGWTIKDIDDVDGVHMYEWNHDFVIEHENDSTDWTYELLKLNFIRADVKIVIGYVDNNKRDDECEKFIKAQVKHFSYPVENNEEYYVVLMNNQLSEDEDPFDMRVYSIRDRSVRLEENI